MLAPNEKWSVAKTSIPGDTPTLACDEPEPASTPR